MLPRPVLGGDYGNVTTTPAKTIGVILGGKRATRHLGCVGGDSVVRPLATTVIRERMTAHPGGYPVVSKLRPNVVPDLSH